MVKSMLVIILSVVLLGGFSLAHAQSQTNNQFYNIFYGVVNQSSATTGSDIVDLMINIGGFLMVTGGVIAGIVLIVAGLMYMAAGSNPAKVTAARSIFKNGVIGALIIFGFGLIINTVMALGTDPFGFFS